MNIGHVVIYSTSPEKKVVGFFSVPKVTRATPRQLWNDFKHVGCVKKEFLIDYFTGYKHGLAIHVGKVSRARKPFSLEKIKRQNPPQSFSYLENDVLKMIKSENYV